MTRHDDLLAERFGPSLWWETPPPRPDDELVTLQRRWLSDRAVAGEVDAA